MVMPVKIFNCICGHLVGTGGELKLYSMLSG